MKDLGKKALLEAAHDCRAEKIYEPQSASDRKSTRTPAITREGVENATFGQSKLNKLEADYTAYIDRRKIGTC